MIISLSIQKGGTGKTISSVMLAQFYSYVREYRVLLIDLDPQGNATQSFIDKDGTSLEKVIIGRQPLSTIIKKTNIKNLDIIPSDIQMETLETSLMNSISGGYRLRDLIQYNKLRDYYDIIIIDTPAHLGRLTANALIAADYVLIPLEPKPYAATGLDMLFQTIEEIQTTEELNPRLKILGVYINKFEDRTNIAKGILESLKSQIPELLLDTYVRFNVRVDEVVCNRENLYTYDRKCNAAVDFAALGETILQRALQLGTLLPEHVKG